MALKKINVNGEELTFSLSWGDKNEKIFFFNILQRNRLGSINNVLVENWNAEMWGKNTSSIEGFDADHVIEDVTFDNHMVNGCKVDSFDKNLWNINGFVRRIFVK